MRALLAAVAFTLGALIASLQYERETSTLKVKAECDYHEGYNEGYRQGQADERTAQERYSVVYKDVTGE